jgi:selenophosphate synthase
VQEFRRETGYECLLLTRPVGTGATTKEKNEEKQEALERT